MDQHHERPLFLGPSRMVCLDLAPETNERTRLQAVLSVDVGF